MSECSLTIQQLLENSLTLGDAFALGIMAVFVFILVMAEVLRTLDWFMEEVA